MFRLLLWVIAAIFRPKTLLIAENLCLRQQLLVLQRRYPRPRLQCGSSLLDIGESMVWWLASSAPHRKAGDGLEVAPTGLEGLLDVAVTSRSEAWSPPASAEASGPHPAHGRRKIGYGVKSESKLSWRDWGSRCPPEPSPNICGRIATEGHPRAGENS